MSGGDVAVDLSGYMLFVVLIDPEDRFGRCKRHTADHDSEDEAREAWRTFQPPSGWTVVEAVILPPDVRRGEASEIVLAKEEVSQE